MATQRWVGRSLRALLLCPLVVGCGGSGQKLTGVGGQTGTGQGGAGNSPTTQVTLTFGQTIDNKVDILFVITNAGSTLGRQKLLLQLPTFVQVLKNSPFALDLHIAVVTTDMGAPGDATSSLGCSASGDDGAFKYAAEGTCSSTTLAGGATYLTDDGYGNTNFTDPIGTVLQCIALVGDTGCGFVQPLSAAVHALGADNVQAGTPTPPPTNVGFLRQDASLAIILVDDRDDCSAPLATTIYSLNGYQQNIMNPDGPLDLYRCSGGPRGAHYCQDPANNNLWIVPPLSPPSDAQGMASNPTLNLLNCQDNEQPPMGTGTSALTPVSEFVSEIKALKTNPDNQILVAGIIGPPTPYTVEWVPAVGGQDLQPGELWPDVMLSCGPQSGDVSPGAQFSTDGSAAEPGVRQSQFLNAFPNFVQASICDPSYAATMTATATKITQLPAGQNCLTGTIQNDVEGNPNCTVTVQVVEGTTTKTVQYPNCADTANTPPCWTVNVGSSNCTGVSFATMDASSAPGSSTTVTCTLCNAPGGVPGC